MKQHDSPLHSSVMGLRHKIDALSISPVCYTLGRRMTMLPSSCTVSHSASLQGLQSGAGMFAYMTEDRDGWKLEREDVHYLMKQQLRIQVRLCQCSVRLK